MIMAVQNKPHQLLCMIAARIQYYPHPYPQAIISKKSCSRFTNKGLSLLWSRNSNHFSF